jgi:hypothetical protein
MSRIFGPPLNRPRRWGKPQRGLGQHYWDGRSSGVLLFPRLQHNIDTSHLADWGVVSRVAHGPWRLPLIAGLGGVLGVLAAPKIQQHTGVGAILGVCAALGANLLWTDLLRLPFIIPTPDQPAPQRVPE